MEKRFYSAKGKIFLFMLIVLAAGVFFAWLAADMVLNEENRELFMLIIFFYVCCFIIRVCPAFCKNDF
ncbi:hypothetical protein ACQCVH_19010 [Bacillus infantis]|uniref:hypothetical protein n=1 Tax=Bacillus infantis TaxID=324767 RepID=UPI003CF1A476